MITESVIIFGGTGNVVMVLNGALPKNSQITFRISDNSIDLFGEEGIIYSEKGLSPYACERLRGKNEIGLVEITDQATPPKELTGVAYKRE